MSTAERRWEERATHRAMSRMAESEARSGRPSAPALLVAAAQQLSRFGDFTVKQVADRAGVALQTFYRHFGSKDELLLAVLEENILEGNAVFIARADQFEHPLERLESVVRAPLLIATAPADLPGLRFHARERVRLSEQFPAEVEACLSPYRDLLAHFIEEAAAAGAISPVEVTRDAEIVLHLVLTYTHNVAAHAFPYEPEDAAGYLWDFCLAALRRGQAVDGVAAGPASEAEPALSPR